MIELDNLPIDADPEAVAAALAEFEQVQLAEAQGQQYLTDAERALVAAAEDALDLELELVALGLELDTVIANETA